ncbi:hypothetical protein OJF2_13560 [Aquisphaera giovannonii]|uniref:Outer membrane lipoprotein carrier protein LolA n=1 Tax=Aquisphaera giovannonii TaxID=406548 RepID=A0A5B9VY79_9BACT|nr:outer membrane lipoprotein-sorting protein [Aquisphaera giovannonii]QEH32871.1 hypothetical protein OJF2_13560 [Aquisphaera giovannonii]
MRRRSTFHLAHVLASWAALAGAAPAVIGQEAEQAPAAAEGAARPAPGGEAAAAEPQPGDPVMMEKLLRQWEKQSSLLKTLDVAMFRKDTTPAWGTVEYYEGRALFQSPNLAFIDFSKIQLDDNKKPMKDAKGKWVSTHDERIVCTGTEVWQYKTDTKQIFVFPLQGNAQQKAVEEGPLPFLFNMKADDARRRYKMSYVKKDVKANAYLVRIEPRLAEDKETFSIAFVNLDCKFLLPVRIHMTSPDGKSTKDYTLGPMYPNKKVSESNFKGKVLPSPWKLVKNPMGQDNPRGPGAAPGAAGPRREAPAARPAAARRGAEGMQRE